MGSRREGVAAVLFACPHTASCDPEQHGKRRVAQRSNEIPLPCFDDGQSLVPLLYLFILQAKLHKKLLQRHTATEEAEWWQSGNGGGGACKSI